MSLDGKNIEGKWFYGDLVRTKEMVFICKAISKTRTRNYYIEDSSTIGQYTGLKDKNGVKIFEGDIVTFAFKAADYRAVIEYSSEYASFILTHTGDVAHEAENLGDYNIEYVEVIGNIYENADLLEEK